MHADDFPDQHLAPDIGVEAVIGPFRRQDGLAGIVEVGLQVDVIGLLADKGVDGLHLGIPVGVSRGLEGQHDIGRVDRRQSQCGPYQPEG